MRKLLVFIVALATFSLIASAASAGKVKIAGAHSSSEIRSTLLHVALLPLNLSASNARDRNSPIKAHQINLCKDRSSIGLSTDSRASVSCFGFAVGIGHFRSSPSVSS
jgi:hypothetical protein